MYSVSFLYLKLTLVPCRSFVVTIVLCVGLFIVITLSSFVMYCFPFLSLFLF